VAIETKKYGECEERGGVEPLFGGVYDSFSVFVVGEMLHGI